jgi:hypothetical protein
LITAPSRASRALWFLEGAWAVVVDTSGNLG